MISPAGVGAEIEERCLGIGGSVPHDVVRAPSGLRLIVVARDRIAEQKLPFRQTEGVALEISARMSRGNIALVQHGAPGNISGVAGLEIREELLAHGGAHAVGADEKLAVDA